MNYYPRHLGDYARDAGYLSMTEHGAYTLLLDWYYANERPIQKEMVYPICKAVTRPEKQAAEKVLREFFYLDDKGHWAHKRVEAELSRMKGKQAKAKQSAMARWDANAMRTHSDGNANAMLSNNQYPITKNQGALAGYSEQPESARRRAGTSRITPDLVVRAIGGTKA